MTTVIVDPDSIITSTFRSLKDYVLSNAQYAEAYDFIWSYPASETNREKVPLKKPIVYFEIVNIENPVFGFGSNTLDGVVDEDEGTIVNREVTQHIFEFECGIWASAVSGGVSIRLSGYQMLRDLFYGSDPYYYALKTHNFEIKSFDGGTFMVDTINEQEVYRIEDITLMIQAFGRKEHRAAQMIETITQDPDFMIDGQSINE